MGSKHSKQNDTEPASPISSIQRLRTERGLTLQQLSKATGYSIPHISELERGKKRLNATARQKIADALGVSLRDPFEPKKSNNLGDQEERLLSLFGRLTETEKDFVLRTMRGLLEFPKT